MNFSAYRITWVELRPATGYKMTKADANKCGAIVRHNNGYGYMHFASRERALEWLKTHHSLSKVYECRLFTDKQFGMAQASTGYAIPFTSKQYSEVFYVG